MTIPYLSAVSMTWSSRMEPPGCTIYCTPDCLARSTLSPKGKNASEPRVTPERFSAIHSRFSSGVSFSAINSSMALSRSGRRTFSGNFRARTLGCRRRHQISALLPARRVQWIRL